MDEIVLVVQTKGRKRKCAGLERRINSRSSITGEINLAHEIPAPRPQKRRGAIIRENAGLALSEPASEGPDTAQQPERTFAPTKYEDGKNKGDTGEPKPKKRRRKKKVQSPVVYNIPDVVRKETTFRGRLGYACLNTVLRARKPDPVFCSRTCRIETIEKNGMQFVFDLALQNVRDLGKLIEWNEANNIKFMRVSSEMFPFASHPKYGYDLSFADEELKVLGRMANSLGHRLTTHPGQFTQLGSPKEGVVTQSVNELEYHCEMIDRMELGVDSVMIIHMGGVYGDKQATLERFKHSYGTRLSDRIKSRLVLENDEICYNLDDLIPVCDELNIPIVVDYHHDWINPSTRPVTELIPIVNQIWQRKGIKVKQHHSEPRPGAESVMEKRAHADRCKSLPEGLPDDVDLMIEAKDKEQAVFELYRVYNISPVIHENLRPPNPAPMLATAGRKSSAKQRYVTSTLDSALVE
ncbi:UV-endonuclease UvdE-domain-containing protein [Cantharellus anzutake]|uniref:UV-endonuclease UvdE-domain-containing protein n=1 Tax=Cantharellus anzutake TaxID=1750568 RepID=UPI001902FD0E|nr:UV-endonuclease UvdE-domain-containing protein [Cantharellus anzutake]KAF8327179.1 UV-endonuclease UvdE-domain-containing protein [Cantharellus anzutake]